MKKYTIVCLDHDEVDVTLHAEGSNAKGAAQGLCRENDFIKEVLVVFPGHLEPENACSWLYEDLV